MLEKDIINTWICYKISNGEREEWKEAANTSEMTFSADGRLTYKFLKDNTATNDSRERHWKIDYKNEMPVLLIHDEETYQIISLQDGILILESIKGDGFRHYYADTATFSDREKLL